VIHHHPTRRRGHALVATMILLTLGMLLWTGAYRQLQSTLQIEKSCLQRVDDPDQNWALAWGMRLLETGLPPTHPTAYSCTVTRDDQSCILTYTPVGEDQYELIAQSIPLGTSPHPDAPATFAE
jgi:hypothetical protein